MCFHFFLLENTKKLSGLMSELPQLQNVAFALFKLRKSSQPTGLQMSRQGLYLPKIHILGQQWRFLGQTSQLFWESANVLVPTYQNTTQAPHSHFFWLGMAPNGPEKPIIGHK